MDRIRLPAAVCFRVTRYCNAASGFCLAPPDGAHPDETTLKLRLVWVIAPGVRTVHFCGGEPTIHPAVTRLVDYVHAQGGKTGSRRTGSRSRRNFLA
jgi:molybdenum cofactor biosynthesis enzyme MoaA